MREKKDKFVLKDSGHRREFDSGAVRDRAKGKGRYDLITPFALKRLADIYEKGAEKYDDRNWEKGMPFTVFLDSTLRHIVQYLMRETDEDHLGQATWNLFALMHFEHTKPELDDRPKWRGCVPIINEEGHSNEEVSPGEFIGMIWNRKKKRYEDKDGNWVVGTGRK